MKIVCETSVVNRQYSNVKNRLQKSTLAIGKHPPNKENTQFYIMLFTVKNHTGQRYQIQNNIDKVFTRFLNEGKITISFKVPEHDIQIKSDAVQMKAFLNVLKLVMQGKQSEAVSNAIPSFAKVTKHDPGRTKLVIHSRKDYPIKGLPRTLIHLEMSEMKFCRVDSQVFLLKNLTHLNLSSNLIERIPVQLGTLRLSEINFSNNNLEQSNWKWLLGDEIQGTLGSLNLSDNKVVVL